MFEKKFFLSAELYEYLVEHSAAEDELLRALRIETQELRGKQMLLAPEQGQFLNILTQILAPKKCVEVGVFTGYSSIVTARNIQQGGKLIACDISNQWQDICEKYWEKSGVADKIEFKYAPAQETLQAMLDNGEAGSVDFMFLDADKEMYHIYYEQALQLLRPGGVILVDNVFLWGLVANPAKSKRVVLAMREFNDMVSKDNRVSQTMIPMGDGFTLIRKN